MPHRFEISACVIFSDVDHQTSQDNTNHGRNHHLMAHAFVFKEHPGDDSETN